jgi:hypothetical protein
VLGAVVTGAGVWLAWPTHREPITVEPWPVASLPKHLYKTARTGFPVAVAFGVRLVPTADPLVWEYRPSQPPIVPPTYVIHFITPPSFTGPPPYLVEGVVDRLVPDPVRRINGVPGYVRLVAASPQSP